MLDHANLGEGLKWALNWEPEAIWVLAVGQMKEDEQQVLQTVKEANARRRIPMHTALGFTNDPRHPGNHLLWQLARDSGGTCINEQ